MHEPAVHREPGGHASTKVSAHFVDLGRAVSLRLARLARPVRRGRPALADMIGAFRDPVADRTCAPRPAAEAGGRTSLRIDLGRGGLGRVRFAAAPAPALETVLVLFELGTRQHAAAAGPHDRRTRMSAAFPAAGRPLVNLVPPREHPLYLEVLAAIAQESLALAPDALAAGRETAGSVHARNVAHVERLTGGPAPAWLRRHAEGDRALMKTLDRALRAVHDSCLAPQWATVTARFHEDVARRSATTRDLGLGAMLENLHPALRLTGDVLEAPYAWHRQVCLDGERLTLMPSAFWTGHPLLAGDPLNPSRHVLVYSAEPTHRPSARRRPDVGPEGQTPDTTVALAALLGTTRAAVLRALRQPGTTGSIAQDLAISAATASHHTTALRDAGLVESHRQGKNIEHRLTLLGARLLTRGNR